MPPSAASARRLEMLVAHCFSVLNIVSPSGRV